MPNAMCAALRMSLMWCGGTAQAQGRCKLPPARADVEATVQRIEDVLRVGGERTEHRDIIVAAVCAPQEA